MNWPHWIVVPVVLPLVAPAGAPPQIVGFTTEVSPEAMVALVLAACFAAYFQPGFMFDMATRIVMCF